MHHVHRIPRKFTTIPRNRRTITRNTRSFPGMGRQFPGMCRNSQELTPTCTNPGNDFEGVVEKVPFGDHIPRSVGRIPGNSTNPGNEFQNKIAGLVVFCMRSQDCDTCSLNPGKNSQDCDSHSWEFDHQERNAGNETEGNVQCSHEFGENSQEL